MSRIRLESLAGKIRQFISHSTDCPDASPLDEAEFNSLALELFDSQLAANFAYRRFCENQQMGKAELGSWSRIPFIPTRAFKEVDLSCLQAGERTNVFNSSGTSSQKPSRHYHNEASLALYESSLWPWFKVHVTPDWPGQPGEFDLLALTPSPDAAPHSSLVHMFSTIERKLRPSRAVFASIVAGDGSWSLEIEKAVGFLASATRPVLLLGTAFLYVHLLDGLRARKLTLPKGSRILETGGYKGRSRTMDKHDLHAALEGALGVPASHIVCEFGMSELSSQAYDHIIATKSPLRSRCFHFPPWARAQVISPETGREVNEGETGLLRVCDLANVFSALAVQTEDLAVRRGTGFELIGRAPEAEPRGCSRMS